MSTESRDTIAPRAGEDLESHFIVGEEGVGRCKGWKILSPEIPLERRLQIEALKAEVSSELEKMAKLAQLNKTHVVKSVDAAFI